MLFRLVVIRLKARASVPISSGECLTETRADRSPAPTRSAAVTSLRIGLTSRLASQSATQMEMARISSDTTRSEEHTSELQSLMRTSYAVFCLQKKNK